MLLTFACSQAPRPAAGPTPGTTAPALPEACARHSAPPPAPAGPRSSAPLWQLAAGLNGPDDLLFHDGSLLVGEINSGRIDQLTPGLPIKQLPQSVPKVEGMVYAGSRLLAADQQDDRLQWVDDGSLFLQLKPVPGKDGVDGIAGDGRSVIVPDSPNGNVLWVDPGSKQVTKTVGGFSRPTGAWPEADGSLLVADEDGNAAYRVRPDGSRETLISGLPVVDDVAADSSDRIFAVTPVISGGRLAEISDHQAHDLVSGLVAPQGLVFDRADNAIVSEEDAGRVDLAVRSFKLVPVAGAKDGEDVCIDIVRAPGFGGDVRLSAGGGLAVLSNPGGASQGSVRLKSCGEAPCLLTARSGGLSDQLWIAAAS